MVKVAQVFQDADWVRRAREAGAQQELDIVESDLDLVDLAKQVADRVQVGTTAIQGFFEAPLGSVELCPVSDST